MSPKSPLEKKTIHEGMHLCDVNLIRYWAFWRGIDFLKDRRRAGELSGDRAILRSVYKGILPAAVAWNCMLSLGRVQKFQYIKCSSIVPAKERGGPLRRMSVPRGGGAQQWQPLLMHINILASDATYFRPIQMTPSRKTNTCSAAILRSSVTRSSPEPRGLFVKARPEIIPFP